METRIRFEGWVTVPVRYPRQPNECYPGFDVPALRRHGNVDCPITCIISVRESNLCTNVNSEIKLRSSLETSPWYSMSRLSEIHMAIKMAVQKSAMVIAPAVDTSRFCDAISDYLHTSHVAHIASGVGCKGLWGELQIQEPLPLLAVTTYVPTRRCHSIKCKGWR